MTVIVRRHLSGPANQIMLHLSIGAPGNRLILINGVGVAAVPESALKLAFWVYSRRAFILATVIYSVSYQVEDNKLKIKRLTA